MGPSLSLPGDEGIRTRLNPIGVNMSHGSRRLSVRIGIGSFLVSAGVLCLAVGIHYWKGIPIQLLTRDPAASTGEGFYLGAVSNYGMILWSGAFTACLLAALVLASGKAMADRNFFLGGGSLTALLLVDDFYMLHERVFPTFLGLPDRALLATEAVLFLALIFLFRNEIRRSGVGLLLLAVLGFGASLGIDRIPEFRLGHWHHLCEDGTKLLGSPAGFLSGFRQRPFASNPLPLVRTPLPWILKTVGKGKTLKPSFLHDWI